MAKARKHVPPTCSCLLLCDDVVVSHATGKHTLVGVIGAMAIPEIPAVIGGYVVYARGSNVHGKQAVSIVVRRPSDNEPVFEIEAEFVGRTPLNVYTLIARIPAFKVEETGRFMFSAESGGTIIAQTPIEIRTIGGTP